jgi:hypothetical protein
VPVGCLGVRCLGVSCLGVSLVWRLALHWWTVAVSLAARVTVGGRGVNLVWQ